MTLLIDDFDLDDEGTLIRGRFRGSGARRALDEPQPVGELPGLVCRAAGDSPGELRNAPITQRRPSPARRSKPQPR